MDIFFILLAITTVAIVGCEVANQAMAAEFTWDYPVPEGCYSAPAEGFIVRVMVDDAEAWTDTVFTNSWIAPIEPGIYRIKVASFYTADGQMRVGRLAAADCTLLPDTLWSAQSDPPVVIEAQAGMITNLTVRLGAAE